MTIVIKRRANSVVAKIEALIMEHGPMTRSELIAAGLVNSKECLGSTISGLIKVSGPLSPQRLHIVDWKHDFPGARSYPRAVYALGPGPNKKKPKPKSGNARAMAYQKKAKSTVSSVFELGLHVKQRIELTRQRRSVARSLDESAVQSRRICSET